MTNFTVLKRTAMKVVSLLILLIVTLNGISQNVAINTDGSTANSKAILDVKSFEKGVLLPRMTQTERDNIAAPPAGLIIYNQTQDKYNYYSGGGWLVLGSNWNKTGNDVYTNGRVAINDVPSSYLLRVANNADATTAYFSDSYTTGNRTVIAVDVSSETTSSGISALSFAGGTNPQTMAALPHAISASNGTMGIAIGAYSTSATALKAFSATGNAFNSIGKLLLQGIGEADGKLLTSDGAGYATWQNPLWIKSGNDLYNTNTTGSVVIGNTAVTGQAALEIQAQPNQNAILARTSVPDKSAIAGEAYDALGIGIMGNVYNSGFATSGYTAGKYGILGRAADGNAVGAFAAGTGNALLAYVYGSGKAISSYGSLQFTGISEGAGKVLTSDASGNATWQTPSGGSSNMSAFIHVTTGGNTSGNLTILSYANQLSTDKLMVTHNFGASGVYVNFHYGVYWNGSAWTIYNEAGVASSMPVGATFNVLLIK